MLVIAVPLEHCTIKKIGSILRRYRNVDLSTDIEVYSESVIHHHMQSCLVRKLYFSFLGDSAFDHAFMVCESN